MKSIILALSIFFAVTANHAYVQKTVAYKSADYTLLVQELNSSLKSPWSMAFLPDNRFLITQKSGTMLIVSANGKTIEHQIENLPTVSNCSNAISDISRSKSRHHSAIVFIRSHAKKFSMVSILFNG